MEIDLICNMASAIRRRWQAQDVVGGFFYKIIKYSSYSFLSPFNRTYDSHIFEVGNLFKITR